MEDAEGREGMCGAVRVAGMWRRRRKRGEDGEEQEIKEKI